MLQTNGITLESHSKIAESFRSYFESVYLRDMGILVPVIEKLMASEVPNSTVTVDEVQAEVDCWDRIHYTSCYQGCRLM